MKLHLSMLTLFVFSLAVSALGQQAKIEGHVHNQKERRVPSVRIVVTPGGQAGRTDSKGHFIIHLPDNIRPGQAARIRVARAGWVVFNPMFGHCDTKSVTLNSEPLDVIIVPKNSPLSYGPKRLSEFVNEMQKQVAKRDTIIKETKDELLKARIEREKYAFLREYAEEYGLSNGRLKAALDRWAQSKESDDTLELARKEYWLGNLEKVTELTAKIGSPSIEQLKAANKEQDERARTVIGVYTLEGNAFYEQSNFGMAMESFSRLDALFSTKDIRKEEFSNDWADLKLAIGRTKSALSEIVAGDAGPRLLLESLAAFKEAETYYTRAQSPPHWALMQNNRGHTLIALGRRFDGVDGAAHLKDAAAVFRETLEIYTRARWPLEWAATQNSLGAVLRLLGRQIEGAESIKYLTESADRHRALLDGDIRARAPQEWAGAQGNLANTLVDLSERVAGAESVKYLDEAVAALHAALKIFTRVESPQEWSAAQNNLGTVLNRLGDQKEGAERLKFLNEAVVAYRGALAVRTREQWPQDWAQTQYNLSDVLFEMGKLTDGPKGFEYLNESAAGLRATLEVRTRAHSPRQWAMTQNALGVTLGGLAKKTEGPEGLKYLDEAAAAHRAALEVHTRAEFPKDWATAQANLADLLFFLGLKTEGAAGVAFLNGAASKYRAALEVLTRAESPQNWAYKQASLGLLLGVLGERAEGAERTKYWNEAIVTLRAALGIFTRTHLPEKWAEVQNHLVSIYVLLEDWRSAGESIAEVLQVFPDDEEMHRLGGAVYHDKLFDFERAFTSKQWRVKRKNDIDSQANFAEGCFTTGRFIEAEQRINALLARPEVPASIATALRAFEIASILALQRTNQVSTKLDTLIAEVARQPPEFQVTWNFEGTRHFIDQNEKLAPYRFWLKQLFDALDNKPRDVMLRDLQSVRAKMKIAFIENSHRQTVGMHGSKSPVGS
ncbi:MAG TPA: hypothetical protein VFX97_01400 [Pyrinomonadaceae bacterium]|nr:hypothetical protein [Pyrinomonadaceae bacterium]